MRVIEYRALNEDITLPSDQHNSDLSTGRVRTFESYCYKSGGPLARFHTAMPHTAHADRCHAAIHLRADFHTPALASMLHNHEQSI